ncbi:hypothetical protein PAHAL_4G291400 [Panicum hallii]|jgi:hypothetical protein|uniref:Uncharacterized protein n=1 Tax=Panicum hallii TaxID=206008 RepID=A0A2T8JEC7_9POAL|nr:uncharacterized protein LOC112890913 [Panicum hallii]PVH48261.1 hypothetical protein PAHAL_4G291400 [Panicum hallii]
MASLTTLTVLFGFYVVFCCLDLLGEAAAKTRTAESAGLPRLAAAALAPAVLATLSLTPLLLYAHVRALGHAASAGGAGAGGRFVARLLAKATLLVAALALLCGAAVRLGGAGGVLGLGGADDVGWQNEK